jgi:hypothetical protein
MNMEPRRYMENIWKLKSLLQHMDSNHKWLESDGIEGMKPSLTINEFLEMTEFLFKNNDIMSEDGIKLEFQDLIHGLALMDFINCFENSKENRNEI